MADSLIRQLRLIAGLVFSIFVVLHLGNLCLGLLSIDALEDFRESISPLWKNPLTTVLLLGALLTHMLLALWSLYQRRNLRMRTWQAIQILLGLALPFLAISHIVGTRVIHEVFDIEITYSVVIHAIWTDDFKTLRQSCLVLVVWGHLLVGLHFWLRLKPWYARAIPWIYPLVILLPVLAMLAFIRTGLEIERLAVEPAWLADTYAGFGAFTQEDQQFVNRLEFQAYGIFFAMVALVLIARQARYLLRNRIGVFTVNIPNGQRVRASVGSTILEALNGAGVPHASVCGGRGRCTTCRIRVTNGIEHLDEPEETESKALRRIHATDNVRLACQVRPRGDLSVVPLLPAGATAQAAMRPGGVEGQERSVVIMFLDLRGSTRLGERLLPYDVVYILNRFFAAMSEALRHTGGHYAQFNGDGLMALYGLESELPDACRAALMGASEMLRRLEALNRDPHLEVDEPLKMGIGIHCGEAIVGRMGPPETPILSALGDSVNIAARLETLTKSLECTLVVSEDVAKHGDVDLSAFTLHKTAVKGRLEPIAVYAVTDPASIQSQSAFADRLVL